MRKIATWSCAAVTVLTFSVLPALSQTKFENGLPQDPAYFPIGVWMQQPRNAPEFAKLGVNLFVGLWNGPTEVQLATLASHKMYAIAAQNDVALTSSHIDVLKGWFLADEPDNAQRKVGGGFGPCVSPATLANMAQAVKVRDHSRPVMVGFGQGVADPTWFGRGSCTGDMEYYSKAVKGSDILTFDIYPAASPRSNIKGKLEYIGRGLDLLMECATHDQTVWAEIETTRIYSDTMVTPAQLRAEVWMSLIHGAKGIVYFVHEWSGGFRDDGIFRHPEIVAAVTDVNRAIGALAPVINSPNVESLNVTGGAGISTMLKWQGSTLYLFAVNERPSGTVVQFKLPKFNKTMQATVLDEERSVAVSNGVFSDTFGGYGVHIYRIALAGATSP